MAEYKILSQKEYCKKAINLFGSDCKQWVFVCPKCKNEQNFWSFANRKDMKHENINASRVCFHGCEITGRDFDTVVLMPGQDVEVFEFGKSIKYTGERENTMAAKSSLKGAQDHAKRGKMPSDFTIASQARKTGKTFNSVKKYYIKRLERKKVRASLIRREKYYKAKEKREKEKYSLPKECEAEQAKRQPRGKRLSEQPITNQMKDILITVEARNNRTIEEQLKSAEASKSEYVNTITFQGNKNP